MPDTLLVLPCGGEAACPCRVTAPLLSGRGFCRSGVVRPESGEAFTLLCREGLPRLALALEPPADIVTADRDTGQDLRQGAAAIDQ